MPTPVAVPSAAVVVPTFGRPELLARAVGYLLDHPADAARMAEAARTRLGDRFGVAALREALASAYAR